MTGTAPAAAPPAADTPPADGPKSAFEAVQLELTGKIETPDPVVETPPADPAPADPVEPAPDAPPAAAEPAADTETPPADTAAQKAAEAAAPAKPDEPPAAKRPSDEFGTLDERVSEKTRGRFEAMKTRYDEQATQLEQSRAAEQRWIDTIKSTGATPEQFGQTLEYMRYTNSTDPDDQEKAFTLIQQGYLEMAKRLGKPVAGAYDPLDDYPDLKEKVADGLDRSVAIELAGTRRRGQLNEQHQRSVQQQNDGQVYAQQQLDAVSAFAAEMRARDPLFNEKVGQMKAYVEDIVAELPPDKWVSKIRDHYSRIVVQPAAPTPPPAVNTGMRPGGGPGSGAAKDPSNPLEAMQRGMGWTGA